MNAATAARKPRTSFSRKTLVHIGFSAEARQGATAFGRKVELTGNETDDFLLGYDYAANEARKAAPAVAFAQKQGAARTAQDQF